MNKTAQKLKKQSEVNNLVAAKIRLDSEIVSTTERLHLLREESAALLREMDKEREKMAIEKAELEAYEQELEERAEQLNNSASVIIKKESELLRREAATVDAEDRAYKANRKAESEIESLHAVAKTIREEIDDLKDLKEDTYTTYLKVAMEMEKKLAVEVSKIDALSLETEAKKNELKKLRTEVTTAKKENEELKAKNNKEGKKNIKALEALEKREYEQDKRERDYLVLKSRFRKVFNKLYPDLNLDNLI